MQHAEFISGYRAGTVRAHVDRSRAMHVCDKHPSLPRRCRAAHFLLKNASAFLVIGGLISLFWVQWWVGLGAALIGLIMAPVVQSQASRFVLQCALEDEFFFTQMQDSGVIEMERISASGDTPSLSGSDTVALISRLITKGVVVLIVLAVTSVVQMFRVGVSDRYILLVAGCILSVIALFAYPAYAARVILDRGEPRRSFGGFITTVAGFIPYLFGCYLVFFEGFWRLRLLLQGFSVDVLLISLLYIVCGYIVVYLIYKASEFVRAVDEGRLKLG